MTPYRILIEVEFEASNDRYGSKQADQLREFAGSFEDDPMPQEIKRAVEAAKRLGGRSPQFADAINRLAKLAGRPPIYPRPGGEAMKFRIEGRINDGLSEAPPVEIEAFGEVTRFENGFADEDLRAVLDAVEEELTDDYGTIRSVGCTVTIERIA